jgi:hypothetical protein
MAGNQFLPWTENEHQRDSLLTLIKRKGLAQIDYYRNLPPRWNDHLRCYSLNYHGRAKMISVKNFQLVRPGSADDVLLQVLAIIISPFLVSIYFFIFFTFLVRKIQR